MFSLQLIVTIRVANRFSVPTINFICRNHSSADPIKQWTLSPTPDVEYVLNNSCKFKESLVLRGVCSDSQQAQSRIEKFKRQLAEVTKHAAHYRNALERLGEQNPLSGESSCVGNGRVESAESLLDGAALKFRQCEQMFSEAEYALPNIVTYFDKSVKQTNTDLSQIKTDKYYHLSPGDFVTKSNLTFFKDCAAQLELNIIKDVSLYLEEKLYMPVTVPSFFRKSLLDMTGLDTDSPLVQTKAEMHATPGSTMPISPKTEDNYVYACVGNTEFQMMLMFMRTLTQGSALPLSLYSIGNCYSDHSFQSRLTTALSLLETDEQCHAEFENYLNHIVELCRLFGLCGVTASQVVPRNLPHHAEASVIFEMNGSRIAQVTSNLGYISSRIQAYTDTEGAYNPVRMVSGTLLDIGTLIKLLCKH